MNSVSCSQDLRCIFQFPHCLPQQHSSRLHCGCGFCHRGGGHLHRLGHRPLLRHNLRVFVVVELAISQLRCDDREPNQHQACDPKRIWTIRGKQQFNCMLRHTIPFVYHSGPHNRRTSNPPDACANTSPVEQIQSKSARGIQNEPLLPHFANSGHCG